MNRAIFYLIFIISLSFCQNVWGNASVATSDHLNALSFNPAGLAINHGKLGGIFFKPDINGKLSQNGLIYLANRFESGFAFQQTIDKTTKFLKPHTYHSSKFGFGFEAIDNFNIGISFDSDKITKLGLLYRPYNSISMGMTIESSSKGDFNDLIVTGLAFRPFLNHNLTLGFDAIKNLDKDALDDFTHVQPFIELYPLNGLKLSVMATITDIDNISDNSGLNINLGFVLDRFSETFTSTSKSPGNLSSTGFGFITSTHAKEKLQTDNIGADLQLLKVKLEGTFIEEPPKVNPLNFDLGLSFGPFIFKNDNIPGIQLRTWIEELDKYTNDDKIDGMVIHLGKVRCGFSKRQEIRNALMRFKNAGKKIYVYTDDTSILTSESAWITNGGYYLVSMADEIYIHEQNSVFLTGLSVNFVFYKDLFDKLDITPVVYRVNKDGKSYKGAMDQFLETGLTEEMSEEYNKILDDLYYVFVRDIAEGRGWDTSKTEEVIDNGPYLIAEQAVDAGLITGTMYPDEFNDYIKKIDDKKVSFIDFKPIDPEYSYTWKESQKTNIAIIYAVGAIMPGKSNPGPKGSSIMGDKTIIKAFKNAYENDNIDAVILRIDSGGGSALASDMMWRQIVKSRQDSTNQKPFVVSMSDVAASGGYYIATEADKIVANETTITGSIGVISFWPNFSKLMNKYGINFDDSIKKGKHSDFKYVTLGNRLHNEYERKKIQEALNDIYYKFKKRVIDGRNDLNDIDELDNIALGRIWTGSGGKNVFLVDEIGGLDKAINVTREMLNLSEDTPINIEEYPKIYSNEFEFDFGAKNITILPDILPKEVYEDINLIEKLPVLYSDDMLMILPYEFNIE